MPARRYQIAGRTFVKVATMEGVVHVVEEGQFWKGERSWEHRAVCEKSVGGTPVSLQRLSCARCRNEIEKLRGTG